MSDSDDILTRSDDLDERIAVSDEIEALIKVSRRSQRMLRWLAVSLVFDVLLSIALGIVAIRAQQAADLANSAQSHAYQACLSANEGRIGQVNLWTYLLHLPTVPPRTPEQQQQVDEILVYVKNLYAPVKCVPPQ